MSMERNTFIGTSTYSRDNQQDRAEQLGQTLAMEILRELACDIDTVKMLSR